MRTSVFLTYVALGAVGFSTATLAAGVSEREYKRGYNDCLRGEYDQNQHGASYKRGCRAAENSGKSNGDGVKSKADANAMRNVCRGAVIGRFHHFVQSVRIDNVEHGGSRWQIYGLAILDDGSEADVVCMFSSNGHLTHLNAGQPRGGHAEVDHDGYCPSDVSEANRYLYPGCG